MESLPPEKLVKTCPLYSLYHSNIFICDTLIDQLREMEVKDSHALCYYVLCVVREPVQESTLNFKCPVVVNPDSRRAIQVILESDGSGGGVLYPPLYRV